MTVLDAYAVLAYLRGEPAGGEVATLLRGPATLAAVNAAEVIDQMVRVFGRDPDEIDADLGLLEYAGLAIVPTDMRLASAAGRLRARHHHRTRATVSLADCVAAATALALGVPLATSDTALAGIMRSEGGEIVALPDTGGRRP